MNVAFQELDVFWGIPAVRIIVSEGANFGMSIRDLVRLGPSV